MVHFTYMGLLVLMTVCRTSEEQLVLHLIQTLKFYFDIHLAQVLYSSLIM